MGRVEIAEEIALVMDKSADIQSRDRAMYRVLDGALRLGLSRRFRPNERQVPFTFEDAVQEYFLYLRGDERDAYPALRELRNLETAGAWLLATFRNFVSKKTRNGLQIVAADVPDRTADEAGEAKYGMDRVMVLATMVAYCYQELPPVQRFVFLRMILTFLDRNRALPQRDVAMVLGVSHIYYRVLCNRVRGFAMQVKGRILGGEVLVLNDCARDMRDKLETEFAGWYELLSRYYDMTVRQLVQAEEINSLRYCYGSEAQGQVLHDVADIVYGVTRVNYGEARAVTVADFERFLGMEWWLE